MNSFSMMRAMVVKELREFGAWAMLLALVMGGVLAWALNGSPGQSMVGPMYAFAAQASFIGAGIIAGLAVVLLDSRRGHFAFVVHRPIPRWKLLVAKFVGAAILYFGATTVAFIIATACASQTRFTRAPFDITMVVPSLYFQIAGLPWVACAMLIAARRARWLGSRVFPIVLPTLAAIVVQLTFASLWIAVSVALLMTIVLLIAAAVYFSSNGEYAPLPRWARPLAGILVFAGATATVTIVVNIAGGTVQSFVGEPPLDMVYNRYRVTADGRPFREESDQYNNSKSYDLQGNRLPELDSRAGEEPSVPMPDGASLSAMNPDDPATPFFVRNTNRSFLAMETYLSTFNLSDSDLQWCYVAARRTVEAYTLQGDYVGCLGPDGVFDTTGRRTPFPPGTRTLPHGSAFGWSLILFNPKVAYVVDPRSRSVREIFRSPPGEPILNATLFFVADDVPSSEMARVNNWAQGGTPLTKWLPYLHVLAVTPGKVHVRKVTGDGPAFTVQSLPNVWNPYVNVSLLKGNAIAVQCLSLSKDLSNDGKTKPLLITQRDGVQTVETLPPLPENRARRRAWSDCITAAAIPPFLLAVLNVFGEIGQMSAAELGVLATAAILATGLTLLLARRLDLPRGATILWTVLATLIGLHIPLTLLCLREWPAKARCPACNRRRPVGTDRCPHCDAAWPIPGDPATDVFEDGPRAAA